MAGSQGRGLRPGGVLRALWRLIVLIVIGFGVGLLFGVVTEEPELLAGHLRGESQSVALDSVLPNSAQENPSQNVVETVARTDATGGDAALKTRIASDQIEKEEANNLPAVASPRSPSSVSSPRKSPAVGTGESIPVARQEAVPEAGTRAMRAQSRWSIQVGAFSDQAAAQRLAAGLRGRYPVDVLPASGKSGRWRVRIQPIRSEDQAREMAERLKQDDRLPTWVTQIEGRAGS